MAKRFTDTLVWDDDWFYELSPEYKLFWFYIKDDCDHAGIWKPKTKAFAKLTDINIDLDKALSYFNEGKQRIRKLSNGYWFIEDFFCFQYVKKSRLINLNSKVHKSIYDLYESMGISLSSVNGIDEVVTETGEIMKVADFEYIFRRV